MLRNLGDAEPEMVKTITTRDLSVGEANNPPKVAEAPKKAPVKIVAKPKEDPLSAVRIVRGTDATSYEVQPDKRPALALTPPARRSEEHTSELQSLMRISYAVFCLKKNK